MAWRMSCSTASTGVRARARASSRHRVVPPNSCSARCCASVADNPSVSFFRVCRSMWNAISPAIRERQDLANE
jgi:hypothetical protein